MNFISNLKSISDSEFVRPDTTYQDTLQNKTAMSEKLNNYERVDDINIIPINTHLRYVTLDKDKKQVFRLGGFLIKNTAKYVQLTNGNMKWSVQKYHYDDNLLGGSSDSSNDNSSTHSSENSTNESSQDSSSTADDGVIFETIFFKIISPSEKRFHSIIDKQKDIIDSQSNTIKNQNDRISKLEDAVKTMYHLNKNKN